MSTFRKTGQTVSTATYMHYPDNGNSIAFVKRAVPKPTKVRGKSYTVANRLYSLRTALPAASCGTNDCPPEFPRIFDVRISALQGTELASAASFLRFVASDLEKEAKLQPLAVMPDVVEI